MADAGVVDEDVDAAKVQLGGFQHRLHVGGFADIHPQRTRCQACGGGHVECGFKIQVGDDDQRAFGDELSHDASAETRAAAGDDGDPAFKPACVAHDKGSIRFLKGLRFFQR